MANIIISPLAPLLLPTVLPLGDPRLAIFAAVSGGEGGGGFVVQAVEFEADDNIQATLGMADAPGGTLFIFLKQGARPDGQATYFMSDDYTVRVNYKSSDRVSVELYDTDFNEFLAFSSTIGALTDGIWQPLLISWKADAASGAKSRQMYIGDTDVRDPTQDGYTTGSFSVALTIDPFHIGSLPAGSDEFVGDMAELWFKREFIDISVEANRRKFIAANGKPVDLGSDGSTPTGAAPEIYLSVRPGDVAADFVTNRGTGGGFTQNGTLTLAGTSPSD